MPSHRLLFALSLSVSLHLMAFGVGDLLCRMQKRPPPQRPAMLDATLRLPLPDMVAESLLKDTLAPTETRAKPKPAKDVKPTTGRRIAEAVARKKLAQHVYYPEAAVAAGIEGQVRLLLTLDDSGGVKDVQIAESSGHTILDRAAVSAAYAMGSLPGLAEHEIILPVTFRLQP